MSETAQILETDCKDGSKKKHKKNPTSKAGRYVPAIALFIIVCIVFLSGDQALKYYSFSILPKKNPATAPPLIGQAILMNTHAVVLVPKVLSLRLTLNRGAVFGIGQGRRWVFVIISFIAIVIIGFIFYRSPPRAWYRHIALGLILAGALGNLWDRIVYGAVRDMLWLLPGSGLWPWVFNLADVALLCGVAIVFLTMFSKPNQ